MIYQQTIDKNLMFLKENAENSPSSLRSLVITYTWFQVSSLMIKAIIIRSVMTKKKGACDLPTNYWQEFNVLNDYQNNVFALSPLARNNLF